MAPLKVSQKVLKLILVTCVFAFLVALPVKSWLQVSGEKQLFSSAEFLWQQKRWEDAVLAYEEYLNKYPDGLHTAQAYMTLGQYLEAYNRFDEALDFYQQGLIRAKGRTAEVLQTEIAAVQTRMGNFDKAIEIYQSIMRETKEWDLFKVANRNLKAVCRLKAAQEIHGKKGNRNKCGVECLKVVLRHFGIVPREDVLKKYLKGTGKGISLESLRQAALAHGVKSYGLKFENKNPDDIKSPAILHFYPGHYLVFQGITQKGVKVFDPIDPKQKEKIVSRERLKKNWTGYALFFNQVNKMEKGVTLLNQKENKAIFGGDDWYHSEEGSSLFGGPEHNRHIAFDDPPNILVNTSTLNLVIKDIDGVWKGLVSNIILKRTYNADDSSRGMFGNSWHFQYEIFLTENPSDKVSLTRGSGKVEIFTSQGDGTYAPPKGVFDKLKKEADGTYTLFIKNTKETYYFDTSGYLTAIVDKNGNRIEFSWGQHGITKILIHYANSATRDMTFEYGGSGLCIKVNFPDGRFATFAYDDNGNLLTSTDMAGYQTTYTYDQYNYINSITDPLGTSQITYQESYWNSNVYVPQIITDPEENQRTYEINSLNVVTITDDRGHQAQYTASGTLYTGFTTKIVDAYGSETSFEYDNSYGNRTSVTDPSGQTWTMSYDPDPSRGNLTQITDPMMNSITMSYDANDNLISIDAPEGRHSEFQYDDNHNLIKVIDALSQEVNLTYNVWGKLTKIQLPGDPRPEISFTYDTYGNLLSETDPEGHPTQFTYDDAGRVISRTDANGAFVQFQYDNLDRLIKVSYPNGNVAYEYDCCSLIRAWGKDGREMTLQYDGNNRLTRYQDLNGFVIQYGYDGVGNLTSLTYPGNKVVTYEYDNVDRLITVIDWLENHTEYTYDSTGNVVEMSYPNGTSTKFWYDKNHLLTVLENFGVPDHPLPQFAYKLDALGNRIGETRRNMGFYEPPAQNVSYAYDLADRINGTTFDHDNNGNLIQKTLLSGVTNYSYDYNNMLTQVQTPSQTYQYEYDPLLNRISRQVGSEKRLFVVDPNRILPQVLMRTDAGKNPTDYYVYGLGLVSRIDPAGNTYYYHYDGLGSTVAITDDPGNVVNRYAYGPFGELLNNQESFENPFRYVGRFGVMDEGNGLLYMRARYYDPEVGRFITKDPIRLLGGLNMYIYVRDNPIKFIDPLGLLTAKPQTLTPEQRIRRGVVITIGGIIIAGVAAVYSTPVGVIIGCGFTILGGGEVLLGGILNIKKYFDNYADALDKVQPGAGDIFRDRTYQW